MDPEATRDLVRALLPRVSRSFALSLRILPPSMRIALGLTYLLARAADTMADTRALPPAERRAQIGALRAVLRGEDADALAPIAGQVSPEHPRAERELLARLPEVVAAYRALPAGDQALGHRLLLTLTEAMCDTLAHFPAEETGRLVALETRTELARYTYANAGCVGEFWTDMMVAHRPRCARGGVARMRPRAIRYGHGLQLTNVLRDLPRDLRSGRCYLPRADLARLGLEPEDLLEPSAIGRARTLVLAIVEQARADLEEGLAFVLSIPRSELRLRLGSVWPLLIGLQTLKQIARRDDLLDPTVQIKVPRREVRRLLALSVALAPSNRGLGAFARVLAAAVTPA